MSHVVRESFRPVSMGVNSSVTLGGNHIGCFLAATSGTLTISIQDGSSGTVTTVTYPTIPVTEGILTPMPFTFPSVPNGCTVALGGGASGILGV